MLHNLLQKVHMLGSLNYRKNRDCKNDIPHFHSLDNQEDNSYNDFLQSHFAQKGIDPKDKFEGVKTHNIGSVFDLYIQCIELQNPVLHNVCGLHNAQNQGNCIDFHYREYIQQNFHYFLYFLDKLHRKFVQPKAEIYHYGKEYQIELHKTHQEFQFYQSEHNLLDHLELG